MLSAVRRDKRRKTVGGDRIGHDRTCLFAQKNCGNERYQAIAVDFFALLVHGARSVYVRVENNSEVRMIALHRLADGAHRRFVFGVGNMIGKTAVRLQKLRARRIRSERLQDFIHVKSARSVPRVYENPLAFQGLRFARRAADLFDEILRVGVEIRLFYPASARLFGKRRPRRRE